MWGASPTFHRGHEGHVVDKLGHACKPVKFIAGRGLRGAGRRAARKELSRSRNAAGATDYFLWMEHGSWFSVDDSDLPSGIARPMRVEAVIVAPRAERARRDVADAGITSVVGDQGPKIDVLSSTCVVAG